MFMKAIMDSNQIFAFIGGVTTAFIAFFFMKKFLNGLKTFVIGKVMGLGTNLDPEVLGKWAVVTGATDGIGKAYAKELAKQRFNIILVSRTQSKLDAVSEEIKRDMKVDTKTIQADFSDGFTLYDHLKSELSGLDIGVLVNNVGMSLTYPEFSFKIPNFKESSEMMLNVNVVSMLMMCQIVMPQMLEKKRGVVLNIASVAGTLTLPMLSLYAASKAFVISFTHSMQYEYENTGVEIQLVCPMFVSTNMTGNRRTTWTTPSADDYVKSAIATIGVESDTNGCIAHSLQTFGMSFVPNNILVKLSMNATLSMRKRHLRKQELLKQQKTD